MTRANTNPAASAPAPRPAGGGQRGRQQGPSIDPIRVLRQHMKAMGIAVSAGLVLGLISYFVALKAYPLWGGTVIFEIKQELTSVKDVVTREQIGDEAIARIGQTESAKITSKSLLEQAMSAPDVAATRWGQARTVPERVEDMQEELRVGHRRGTKLFTLSWRCGDKDDVATVLNRIADTYMTAREQEANSLTAESRSRAERRRDDVEKRITTIKSEIQDFIRKNGISASAERDLPEQRAVADLAMQRDNFIRELTIAQSRLEDIDRRIAEQRYEDKDRADALEDPSMKQIETTLTNIQVALREARTRYEPGHKQLQELENREQEQASKFKEKLDETMRRNLLADKARESLRVTSLKSAVERQSTDLATAQRKLQELAAQIAGLDALREQLKQLEAERKETQDFIGQLDILAARPDARNVGMVQRATTPKELDFPQLKYMLPGGAVLVLALVVGVIFLREFLDQRVKHPSDLAGMGGTKLLGVIPDAADDPAEIANVDLVLSSHPQSMTAEMVRQASSSLRKAIDANGAHTVAFVAAHPGAGTTWLVANLALSLHAAGRSVAVVDANFRRPRLAAILGADPDAPGLGDMLMGKAVQAQTTRGVAVYGAGTADSRVYERLSGDEIRRVLGELRERHQVVLVDLPPSLVAGETLVVADSADSTVLVVQAMRDLRGLVAKMIGQLLDTRAALLGTVLMRPEHTVGGYFKKNAELMAEYAGTKEPAKSAKPAKASAKA